MKATEYLNGLLDKVMESVKTAAAAEIKNRTFWKDSKEQDAGAIVFWFVMTRQSKELKKLGGKISPDGWSWLPPKGSRLYVLRNTHSLNELYFLLYLKDGRELLLRMTPKTISAVDHLSPRAQKALMKDIFERLYGSQGKHVEKAIRGLSYAGKR